MVKKSIEEKKVEREDVLTSKQEVADVLKMSVYQFSQLLHKYPFANSGAAGKLNGRWHVSRANVWEWYKFVQRQEIRHPDARRMRPDEPPEIAAIVAR